MSKTEQKAEMTPEGLVDYVVYLRASACFMDEYSIKKLKKYVRKAIRSVIRGETSEQREALLNMINQFAYRGTKDGVNVIHTGGLSALEDAFSAIGLSDPCSEKEFELPITNTSER